MLPHKLGDSSTGGQQRLKVWEQNPNNGDFDLSYYWIYLTGSRT